MLASISPMNATKKKQRSEYQKLNKHNALVIFNALKRQGGRLEVSNLKVYVSDDELLLDAVFYAREYGLIEANDRMLGRGTTIWLTGRQGK